MKRKKQFVSPQVLKQVEVCLEKDLLGGSVERKMQVFTAGQPVNELDFTPSEDNDYAVYWE